MILRGGPFDGVTFTGCSSSAWAFELSGHRYELNMGEYQYVGHVPLPSPDPTRVEALLAKTAGRKAPTSGVAHTHGPGCGCPVL